MSVEQKAIGGTRKAEGKGRAAPRRGRSPIGLDLGARRVKAIQLEHGPDGPRIAAAAVAPRAGSGAGGSVVTAAEVAGLSDLLYRTGFDGRHVVLAAPSARLLTGVMELPPRAADGRHQVPVEQIARMELARSHKIGPDTFEMGCWDLPPPHRNAKGTHLMAVGLPHAAAGALLDAFDPSGLRVRAIDVASGALARACAAATASTDGRAGGEASRQMTAFLDVGWGATMLTLVHRGAVIYDRALHDAGLAELHATVGRRVGLDAECVDYLLAHAAEEVPLVPAGRALPATPVAGSAAYDRRAGALAVADDPEAVDLPDEARAVLAGHADEVAKELDVSFAYATHQYPDAAIGRLVLVGGGARLPGFARRLSAGLGVPAAAVSPADLVGCDGPLLELCASPALTTALGLAMYSEMQNAE